MDIGLYPQDGCEARHRRQSSSEYFSSSSRLVHASTCRFRPRFVRPSSVQADGISNISHSL
ncbi:hypothetical protein B0H12DRAFT_1144552, partial [Mycena haematopus]